MRSLVVGQLASAVLLSFATLAVAAPFGNGSFESGTNPGSYTPLNTGDNSSITGWLVGGAPGNGIDYIGSLWQPSDGSRSIDLNGTNLNTNSSVGSISQTFDTVAGVQYQVQFDLSGNPYGGPATKTLTASAAANSQPFSYTIGANTLANMMWQSNTFNFIATGASTTLTFASTTLNSNFGPALDNVRVSAVTPEPASMALWLLAAGAVTVVARRRQRVAA